MQLWRVGVARTAVVPHVPSRRRLPRVASADQRGQSLVEVLVAVLLTGTVFLAVIAGMLTVLRSTDLNKKMQAIDAGLGTYGGILQNQVAYTPCPGVGSITDNYQIGYDPGGGQPYVLGAAQYMTGSNEVTAQWRRPNNIAMRVVSVRRWNPTSQTWDGGCTAPDSGAQLVRYQVTACPMTSEDPACAGGKVRFGEIVKRKSGPS